jgi:uncharacterized cupredoxin-like copper-binding protein/mono/diheme cytochrome c family protein
VVIVGLVAVATLLVVYFADENNRMAAETVEKEDVAIERGINTFIQNCVVCHGPAGEGFSEPGAKGTGRIGMPLGGNTELGRKATELNQSTDPVVRQQRHDLIVKTLHQGRGLMPAFGDTQVLNDEQIEELAQMIQNVDWNRVYNMTIEASGGYPTFPPPPAPAGQTAPTPAPAGSPAAGGGTAQAADTFTIELHDIFFQPKEVTIPAGKEVTLDLKNLGAAPHNFSIDALKISVDLAPGETKDVKLTAPEGTYEYYCNVPGHKEAGMVGTLVAKPGAAAAQPAANAPAPGTAATPAGAAAPAGEAAKPVEIVAHDIYFDPKEVTIPANTDVTISLPNQGAAPHTFSIDALKISVDLPPGETKSVVVNAPPGTYEYYCDVPGHKEAGMVGTLTVK